jgi:hypothetical protein
MHLEGGLLVEIESCAAGPVADERVSSSHNDNNDHGGLPYPAKQTPQHHPIFLEANLQMKSFGIVRDSGVGPSPCNTKGIFD